MKAKTSVHLLTTLVMIGFAGGSIPLVHAEVKAPVFSDDSASVKSRLENVQRLVSSSSGSQRVKASQNVAAKAQQEKAEQHLRKAEKAYEDGSMGLAQDELQRATEAMFLAIRGVGTGKEGVNKKNRDFDARYESVDALLAAIERVAKEKGGMQGVERSAEDLRHQAQTAKQLAEAGKVEQAKVSLDGVYEETKAELEKLREGETLVRTLEFASDEEEYRYELDRNDTHQMLVKVLLEDRVKKPGTRKQVDGFVAKSNALRSQAEAEAGAGAYDRAVDILEKATKELQRAIRSAGVYIPG
jgi:tetratricopeptide (TPR) repeat protein